MDRQKIILIFVEKETHVPKTGFIGVDPRMEENTKNGYIELFAEMIISQVPDSIGG